MTRRLTLAAALAWALAAPPALAQTEYVYGDLECGLGPGGCALVDFAGSGGGGGGLTPAQVDARVKPYARAGGPGINHTDLDSSTETELRDSIPYDGPTYAWPTLTLPSHSGQSTGVEIRDRTAQRNDARLDALEVFEGAIRTTSRLLEDQREALEASNTAYSLGASISRTGPDIDITVVVTQVGEADGHLLTTRDALVAAGSVTGDNGALNASNGIAFVAAPGTEQYFLGIDTSGNLYGGVHTGVVGKVTFWTVVTNSIDVTSHIAVAEPGGNVDLTLTGGELSANLPASLTFDGVSRGRVGRLPAAACSTGQILKWTTNNVFTCQADATGTGGGSGVTAATAGDGLGFAGGVLSVRTGNGLEVSGDNVQPDLDGTTLDTSADGIKVADLGIGTAQLANQQVTTAKIANDAVTNDALADNAVRTENILDGQVETADLSGGVQAGLHSETEIEQIARHAEAQVPLDPLASFEDVDGATWAGSIVVNGKTFVVSEPDDYASSDSTMGFDFVRSANETFTSSDVAALQTFLIEINDTTLAFGNASCSVVDLARGVDCTFPDVAANPWVSGANNDVVVFHPLAALNFMPRATAADQLCLMEPGLRCTPEAAAALVARYAARAPVRGAAFDAISLTLNRVNVATDLFTTHTALAPAADLDVSPYDGHGEFHVGAVMTVTRTSGTDPNLGFVRNKANQYDNDEDRTVNVSAILYQSDLAAAEAWANTSNPNGLEIARVPLYSLNTDLGDVVLRLVKDSNNVVGVVAQFDTSGAGTATQRIDVEIRVSWFATDTAQRGSSARTATLVASASLPTNTPSATGMATWTLATGAAPRYALTTSNTRLSLPLIQPDGAHYIVRYYVGGTDDTHLVTQMRMPSAGSVHNRTGVIVALGGAPSPSHLILSAGLTGTSSVPTGRFDWRLDRGPSTPFPASASIRIYEAR